MHQLLQASSNSQNFGASDSSHQGSQINEIISLSSFEIVKHLQMPVYLYLTLITFESAYMVLLPAQLIIFGECILTSELLALMTAAGVYMFTIGISALMLLQILFIFVRGRTLKTEQSNGIEKEEENTFVLFLIKFSGYFLTILSTVMSQFLMRVICENLSCEKDYEIAYGCNSKLTSIALYVSIVAIPMLAFLILFSDTFITKLTPNEQIPWSAWNERSRLLRNGYKLIQAVSITLIPTQYAIFVSFGIVFVTSQIVYERFMVPQVYNRIVHVFMVFLECQLFTYTLMQLLVSFTSFQLAQSGLLFLTIGGLFLALLLILMIENKTSDILAVGSNLQNFDNIFDVELYLVVMLHELEKLVQNEDYAHEKHIHAIVGRHMEECSNINCPCKSYEPEYDKKFSGQSYASKRLHKSHSLREGSHSALNSSRQVQVDVKRLPLKINYKTKVEIFKKDFEYRVEMFLQEYPKSYGIKLLKSFFHHKYCDSSYKALFVQLENSLTCKDFKGKVFIYHLKTYIQDEMQKSTESPLTLDINSLLRFEKYRIDFERNLEDLSFNCQTFWTDLTKDDYKVANALEVAYSVSDKIIKIKRLFSKMVTINPLCIDTISTYALVYRHILRDEATFSDLVSRIQQIKNSSKLEQQREIGVRFFDSDIYAMLMVSGDVKEVGRIKQSNSSTRFVFGYDPKDLIGSKINKLMPAPFAAIHDKFMHSFIIKGNSNFLGMNQPQPVITKDGYLQMTLFYVKPMVSLEFGLIFSCFAKKLNKYTLADEAPELIRYQKLCVILTDQEGMIHGMSESCCKNLGIPPPNIGQQLSLNDNQQLNITQLCPQIMQQDLEFELAKGFKMPISSNFLKNERQFRREYPEIASKMGEYQAEIGIHKYQYRDLKSEIHIYVIKLEERTHNYGNKRKEDESLVSKSVDDDEFTYSVFSASTANSSVITGHMATSKFKSFKQKIQSMKHSSQIQLFSRLTLLTFFLLLSVAAGNFAINIVKNQSYSQNLEVVTNLQVLLQQVPDSAHSTRELILRADKLNKQTDDKIQQSFYADSLSNASQLFINIQNMFQTTLSGNIQLNSYYVNVMYVNTDGSINEMTQSIQTAINLFSSKILNIASYQVSINATGVPNNTIIPKISFQWNDTQVSNYPINKLQQDLYFIIQNGLGPIVQGLNSLLNSTLININASSQQAETISIILAIVSILLVLILLPMSFTPLTHVERISQLILMSLNRLPEKFCLNERKSCMEVIMFLNESKEGEKSTHEMIKKNENRKKNRKVLKTLKLKTLRDQDSIFSSLDESEQSDSQFVNKEDTASIKSKASTIIQQPHKLQIKRSDTGTIDLEYAQAKTSDLQDDTINREDEQHSEEEMKQNEREDERQEAISATFKSKRITKFGWLIVSAFVISIYFAITSYYLSFIHKTEQVYLAHYSLIGRRIQCYTNLPAYYIESLARNSNITIKGVTNDAAWFYLQDCFDQEQAYKQMLLDGQSTTLANFNSLNSNYEQVQFCNTLSRLSGTDALRNRNITQANCESVLNGLLTNGGLTESLFYLLRNIQDALISFEDRKAEEKTGLKITKQLLMSNVSNELIFLNNIYLRSTFEQIRTQSLSIIENQFTVLSQYYDLLFGLFVGCLTVFELIVGLIFVKRLQKQIVKMYHVVLLVPFSGRTQNDLNTLMMIKM